MRVSSGGFSVAWDQYRPMMCSGFQELQQREEFVDMTIAADGHLVRAHQMVVGLASPFLKELLRSAPSPHPILFLNNVSHKILCCILEYMYTGETFVPAEHLKAFIVTGKELHVRGLEDMLESEPAPSKREEESEVLEAAEVLTRVASEQSSVGASSARAKESESLFKIELCPISSQPLSTSPKKGQPTMVKHFGHNTKRASAPISNRDMPDLFSPAKMQKMDTPKKIDMIIENLSDGEEVASNDEYDQDQYEEGIVEEMAEQDGDADPVKSTLDGQGTLPKKPNLMYTISNMGGLQVIVNRCLFRVRNKYKDGRRRWECVEVKSKCNASVITSDENILARHHYHNHPYHDKKIMAKVKKGLVFTSIKKAEENSRT